MAYFLISQTHFSLSFIINFLKQLSKIMKLHNFILSIYTHTCTSTHTRTNTFMCVYTYTDTENLVYWFRTYKSHFLRTKKKFYTFSIILVLLGIYYSLFESFIFSLLKKKITVMVPDGYLFPHHIQYSIWKQTPILDPGNF